MNGTEQPPEDFSPEDMNDLEEHDEIDENDAWTTANENDDGTLDAILSAADEELLGYVRSRIGLNLLDAATDRDASRHRSTGPTANRDEAAHPLLDEDLRLGFELTIHLTTALDLVLDLALAIPPEHEYNYLRELARTLGLHIATARDFEPDKARSAELAFALDVFPTLDDLEAARMAGRSRHLDFARILANLAVRGLTRMPDATAPAVMEAAHALVRALDEAHYLELGHAIVQRLTGISVIDVSGVDLSRMRLSGRSVPVGTIWSEMTTWPANMYGRILALSRETRPGSYRVRAAANLT